MLTDSLILDERVNKMNDFLEVLGVQGVRIGLTINVVWLLNIKSGVAKAQNVSSQLKKRLEE